MWAQLLVWVITTVIGALLSPRPAKPSGSAAPTPGVVDVPVAESGKPIPVLFGTRVIRQANVVWFGDVRTTEIRQNSENRGKK
jgi:hypothetical protein